MFLNTYYYHQGNDEETSRDYAYSAVRNILGLVIYMSFIVLLSIITCVFELKISFLNRPTFLVITSLFLLGYLLLTKKKLKPLFSNVNLKKERPEKNNFFVITLILTGLFSGGMYVLGRLLTFYLCG